jgi:hypothetical protein
MRVTRIPGDFNDIGKRECRVWCNGHEVIDWTVADDFRRVVETPNKVHHGAVRIDLAPENMTWSEPVTFEVPPSTESIEGVGWGSGETFELTPRKPNKPARKPWR